MKRLSKAWIACFYAILVSCAVFALSACRPGDVKTLEAAPARDDASFPKAGHWVSEGKASKEASVSFDLSDSGQVTNFILAASIGTPISSCEISIEQAQLNVDKEGSTFVLSYLVEYEELKKQLGAAVMSLGAIPKGEAYEVLHIEGTATETMLTGTYTIHVCGPVLYFQPETGAWNPQWKQP